MNKIALITGGSRGLGEAISRKIAEDGYTVIINYKNSKEKAEALAKELNGHAIQANLEDDKQIEAMFEEVKEKFGKLDLLVNNAGIAECYSLDELNKEAFLKANQVNLWAPILCTKLAKKIMTEGSIIFISSGCSQSPTPDAIEYATSKAGINILAKSITMEMSPKIRINTIFPGTTPTDMVEANWTKEELEHVKKTNPMQRLCDPEDIANTVSFLVSDNAKNITGQIIRVDAGREARS